MSSIKTENEIASIFCLLPESQWQLLFPIMKPYKLENIMEKVPKENRHFLLVPELMSSIKTKNEIFSIFRLLPESKRQLLFPIMKPYKRFIDILKMMHSKEHKWLVTNFGTDKLKELLDSISRFLEFLAVLKERRELIKMIDKTWLSSLFIGEYKKYFFDTLQLIDNFKSEEVFYSDLLYAFLKAYEENQSREDIYQNRFFYGSFFDKFIAIKIFVNIMEKKANQEILTPRMLKEDGFLQEIYDRWVPYHIQPMLALKK